MNIVTAHQHVGNKKNAMFWIILRVMVVERLKEIPHFLQHWIPQYNTFWWTHKFSNLPPKWYSHPFNTFCSISTFWKVNTVYWILHPCHHKIAIALVSLPWTSDIAHNTCKENYLIHSPCNVAEYQLGEDTGPGEKLASESVCPIAFLHECHITCKTFDANCNRNVWSLYRALP